jgi:hypothetical protein
LNVQYIQLARNEATGRQVVIRLLLRQDEGTQMSPNITRYVNKTIFVSIPTLFEDGTCRPYKLLGAELNGLWLQSDELTQRLLSDDQQDLAALAPAVYVPFAQIAGVLVATGVRAETPQVPPLEAAPYTASRPAGARRSSTGTVGDRRSKSKTKDC